VKQDTMTMPVFLQALDCLKTEAALAPNPPSAYHIRPGTSAEPSVDAYGREECCGGLGAITLVANYEGDDASWLEPAGPPLTWAVVLEIKLLRCVPIASDGRGGNVTEAQWLAAAQQQADDGATLRRVLCCMRDLLGADRVASGQVNPLPLQGGCGGVTLQLTVQRDACDCA
jgi:hypothetical protein